MTVAVVAADAPDLPVAQDAADAPETPDETWWLTITRTVEALRGVVTPRTWERLCAAGIPAVKVSSTWRIWRPFVQDLVLAVFTQGSIDVVKFAKTWMATHGRAFAESLLAALSARPHLRALPAPPAGEPEPETEPEATQP